MASVNIYGRPLTYTNVMASLCA